MRYFSCTSVAVTVSLLLISGARIQGQAGGPATGQGGPGQGQMRGAGQGGRGGLGGGQMGQPVQGIVTAATKDSVTVKTDAGDSYEVTVTDTSRIMRNGQAIKLSDVKPGDSVTARGTVDATKKTVQAMMVMDVDAATIAKAKENLGKTYITGKLTAIDVDNLKLTVMRTDNVSQTITVDDGTSFQRGTRGVAADVQAAGGMATGGGFGGGRGQGGNRQGAGAQAAPPPPESITMADIKVGDSVMATGTLKGGVFTVVKMGVAEPLPAGAGRNRGPQEQPPPPGAGPQAQPPAAPPQ